MPPMRQALSSITPYVPGQSREAIASELGLTDLVKLNQNENALGPSPRAVAAISSALGELHRYPEGTAPDLRATLAAHWDLPADWFLVGNGSDEIFRLLAETYLEPGASVVVPAPSFAGYPLVAQLMGAEVVTVPLANHAVDLERIVVAAGTCRARLVFLCRPNSPTGGVFAAGDLERALDRLPRDVLVVLDEAYAEYDETAFDSRAALLRHPNLIVTRTFSKIYGLAGLRLGYGVMRPDLIAPLYRIRDPFSVNSLALVGGNAALTDTEHVERSRAVNHAGKDFLYAALDRLHIRYVPTQANFILFYADGPADIIAQLLLTKGVIVRSCASFGLPTALRVTIGTPDDNERFVHALGGVL